MSETLRYGIAGAGFSGAVIARQLAEAGHTVDVFDARAHVAGNCHTERRGPDGIMVHTYGPHIFHTQWHDVWEFVNRFGEFGPYNHRVKATVDGTVYSMPVNLHTINQFFGESLSPTEAEAKIADLAVTLPGEPANFEEQALAFIGRDLYEAFFEGYTRKQWGVSPTQLPASILKRLPLRFNYDDSYFNHPFQGIPRNGYTAIVESILDHPSITVSLDSPVTREDLDAYDHAIWTGPIDAYFSHDVGRLAYRTLDFVEESFEGDAQGCPVMNYCDADIPETRVTEHKHFAPWETHESSILYREYSRACEPSDIPYYPTRLVDDKNLLTEYVGKARAVPKVSFLGRLGTYRYIDMDVTIREALDAAEVLLTSSQESVAPPTFFVDPLA